VTGPPRPEVFPAKCPGKTPKPSTCTFPACHPGPANQAQTISNTIEQYRGHTEGGHCFKELLVNSEYEAASSDTAEADGAEALTLSRD
jgi:hypothetical protein